MATPPLRRKYLAEFNEKDGFPFSYVSPSSTTCFCKYCKSTFSGTQQSVFSAHIQRAKHKQNIELKKKRTATQALLSELPNQSKKSK